MNREEIIRKKAYSIWGFRQRYNIEGSAEQDWLEAEIDVDSKLAHAENFHKEFDIGKE